MLPDDPPRLSERIESDRLSRAHRRPGAPGSTPAGPAFPARAGADCRHGEHARRARSAARSPRLGAGRHHVSARVRDRSLGRAPGSGARLAFSTGATPAPSGFASTSIADGRVDPFQISNQPGRGAALVVRTAFGSALGSFRSRAGHRFASANRSCGGRRPTRAQSCRQGEGLCAALRQECGRCRREDGAASEGAPTGGRLGEHGVAKPNPPALAMLTASPRPQPSPVAIETPAVAASPRPQPSPVAIETAAFATSPEAAAFTRGDGNPGIHGSA